MSFWHVHREEHGFRFFWHVGRRSVLSIEMAFLRAFCHAYLSTGEKWTLGLAVPGVALWVGVDGFGLWHPQKKCIATWDGGREFWIPDDRECRIDMSDWTLHIVPWGKSMEWASADPWWVKGVSIRFRELLLGRTRYTSETLRGGIPLVIPMPEGAYAAVAKVERCTWKRPRWFAQTRTYVSVDIPKGIPFAGKGENSWDCGDDGLFGYSSEGESLETAIAKGVESVLTSRRRYGMPSKQAISEALTR
jgi:hypothetical protein